MDTNHIKMLFDIGEISHLFADSDDMGSFLKKIVKMVAIHMQTDVCSIYIYNEKEKILTLKATCGLNNDLIDKVKLKLGEGLVGESLLKMQPVLEDDGNLNPQFKYIPGLDEDNFKSLLAFPIIRGNFRIGVLVIQRQKENPFNDNDIMALKAIASQLASLLDNATAIISNIEQEDQILMIAKEKMQLKLLKGKIASRGFALNKAVVLKTKSNVLNTEKTYKEKFSLKDFKESIKRTENELKELQKKVEEKLSDAASLIFEAHLLILKDKGLIDKIESQINKGINPPEAIINIFSHYRNIFIQSPDIIIKEKAQDLEDLASRLIDNIIEHQRFDDKYKGNIIISETIFPSDLLKLSAMEISGLIMVGGGITSHVSILARSLHIPLIITDNKQILELAENKKVLLDAEIGNIYIDPADDVVETFLKRNKARKKIQENKALTKAPSVTTDGIRINILANINLLSDLNDTGEDIIDGIGLYRTEFPFIIRNNFPSEEEQYVIYKKLIKGAPKKAVTFRTLDIGGDKVLSYFNTFKEENPFLGMRSIRFTLNHLDIFKQQVRAILRAGYNSDLKIMFPMIASLDDFLDCKKIINECIKELKESSLEFNSKPSLGIMVELPSLLFIIEDLAKEVDFFSIGSNDLVQYTLAVDRTNEKVAHLYRPHHPAILRSLKIIADTALKYKIGLSICGDMASRKKYIPFLLGIGIRNLSVDTSYIPRVKDFISKMSIQTAEKQSKDLLNFKTIIEVDNYLNKIKV